jgi:hypothetical protein
VRKLALLACLFALACERAAPVVEQTPPPAPQIEPDTDAENLLNMAYGAAVVSRTGELNLEYSAAHAIDSIGTSAWISSPGAPDETLVYSLLSPARIARVGLTTSQGDQVPKRVAFDASMDGDEWRELLAVDVQNHSEKQLWPVTPTVTRYIRVRSLDTEKYYVRARTFHALGDEVAPPETPPFTGCWTINGERASLQQDGARITGLIESKPPIHLEGGTDNRVALLTWQQGATWGHAVLTRTPDGSRLTGLAEACPAFGDVSALRVGFRFEWAGDRGAEQGATGRRHSAPEEPQGEDHRVRSPVRHCRGQPQGHGGAHRLAEGGAAGARSGRRAHRVRRRGQCLERTDPPLDHPAATCQPRRALIWNIIRAL